MVPFELRVTGHLKKGTREPRQTQIVRFIIAWHIILIYLPHSMHNILMSNPASESWNIIKEKHIRDLSKDYLSTILPAHALSKYMLCAPKGELFERMPWQTFKCVVWISSLRQEGSGAWGCPGWRSVTWYLNHNQGSYSHSRIAEFQLQISPFYLLVCDYVNKKWF